MKTKNVLSLCLLFFSLSALGQSSDSPYSFGSSCASQGLWTQRALRVTEEIISVAESLRDDENCKGMAEIFRGFKAKQAVLESPGGEAGEAANNWEQAPGEISAIQTSIATDPANRGESSGLMMQKVLDHLNLKLKMNTGMMTDLRQRTKRTSSAAIDMFEQVVQELPKYDQCLAEKPSEGALLLSGVINMAGVMASSQGDGMLSRVGRTVGTLINVLRERKFNKVLRELLESRYWTSISCLMETTAENYCAVKDAYELIEYSEQEKELQKEVRNQGFNNPLRGYYIMEREVEIVSVWVRRLQFGVEPRLKPIAVFKNSVLDNFHGFWKDKNMVMATFNNAKIVLDTFPTLVGKQNHVYNTLLDLVHELKSSENSNAWQDGADSVNFFTSTVNPSFLPFYLIGLKDIPAAARSTEENFSVKTWDEWMKTSGADGTYISSFNDPAALLEVIGERLEVIMDSALVNASSYFRDMYIVDLQSLINESAVSQTLTVYKALKNIDKYLSEVIAYIKTRPEQDEHSLIILPSIYQTKIRIEDILDAYQPLIDLSKRYLEHDIDQVYEHIRITNNDVVSSYGYGDSADEEFSPEHAAILSDMQNLFGTQGFESIYKNIIDTFFGSFNILLQRDGFLYTRMAPIVRFDYTMRVKDKEGMSDYQQDLLVVSGKHLFDRLQGALGFNIEDMKFDLSQAQVINRRNLKALESLFSNQLLPVILENKLVAEDRMSWETVVDEKNKHMEYTGCLNYAMDHDEEHLLYLSDAFRECMEYFEMGDFQRKLLDAFAGDYWQEQTIPYRASRGEVARYTNKYYTDLIKQGRGPIFDFGALIGRGYENMGYAATYDDPYGSYERLKNKLCLQTLIFEDAKKFFYYCKDSMLTSYSPYENEDDGWKAFMDSLDRQTLMRSTQDKLNKDYVTFNESHKSASYNALFNRFYMEDDIDSKREWRDQNICALRSHLRRNYVYWLTQFQNEQESY